MARNNGIVMITIPPHSSHKLQRLDRGVYGPFKAYLSTSFKNWHLTNPGRTIKVYDIASISGTAYRLAFTPSNILSGFSSSGLWPINLNIFSDHEFHPSSVSDKPHPDMSVESSAGPSNICSPTEANRSTPSVSLEEIRPFPKAEIRKDSRKGGKSGKSRILTDTPEKKFEEVT
ncbi:uncharacterized protein LOC120350359 [Nilaparvata lugens]|uniref:uncharacterized protein LOC120350359 n=1 Tax=Nilaparvata lugens TaxID=108931 RepID=UPI00193D191A|nr:uncharacterized protein LOC120350359 [Nilaparvata lugens]